MNKDNVEIFHRELDMALANLCRKWNLEKVKQNITYSSTDLSISLKLNEKNLDGSFKVDTTKNLHLWSAIQSNLPEHLRGKLPQTIQGLKVEINGELYQIIDWNSRARTYPIIYKRLSDNAQFKCSANYIALYIKKKLVEESSKGFDELKTAIA